MDNKDFQLLVALHEDTRQTYGQLGRRVSLSAPGVLKRLGRLERLGILQGYFLSVDPSFFGREDQMVFYHNHEWTREDALKIVDLPEVGWVAWKVDGGLTIQVWPRDPVAATETLSKVLGMQPSGQTISERTNHPPLSLADWRIIDVLLDNPRMPLKDLTEQVGLSPKTVRKRLVSLVRGKSIFMTPKLGALNDSGDVVYTVAVFGKTRLSELSGLTKDVFVVNQTETPPATYLLCRDRSIGDATTRIRRIGKLNGVESAILSLNREMFVATKFLHSLVQEQIQGLQTPRN